MRSPEPLILNARFFFYFSLFRACIKHALFYCVIKTLCSTQICATQGRFSYFILVSLRISYFTLLRIYGVTLKYQMRRGKVPYSKKGKILHSLNLSKYFFLNQFCPYLFLSRSFLFSLIISEFGQSALTVWELNLSMRGFSFSPSFSSFTGASALANLNALTNGKMLEIKGNKRIWDTRE